ncbi:hypothetical protein HPP92_014573 [Vanilla planifolia]|uniref:Uncharacterized protein n=1 Tax=Vanilla planifolia TaxID=51239 RepID=A0A835QU55_VANPL|nr:hypothetical protein HPP92_014573 [Vanilla planifolia]
MEHHGAVVDARSRWDVLSRLAGGGIDAFAPNGPGDLCCMRVWSGELRYWEMLEKRWQKVGTVRRRWWLEG